MNKRNMFQLLLFALLSAIAINKGALAQERDNEHLTNASPSELAQHILFYGDLVAIGEFDAPIDPSSDLISLLRSREVDSSFHIQRVFKGRARPGETVYVRLRSDMFIYKGYPLSSISP